MYDEAGQLIKEINGADYTEYAYDSKGNISTRKVYSNNTLVSTDNYTYGSETWEDRLTGYNNKTITYDSIGNPTSYLGATLTWRGRELESYTNGNTQISFSYDVDGMRYQKVVKTNGVETSRYDYVYSEGTLVLVTFTADGVSDTARFIYDSYGEPRGFILNDTAAYLYIKNAQGDITGIVDENGEVILTCSYDAWGRVNFGSTNMTHMTLAAKLSQINPFTYRGYCYDYDIGMYYLQSRYYDPEICRFINADSTDYLGATGTLLSYNLYAYCENDGVNGVDPSGFYAYGTISVRKDSSSIKKKARIIFESKNNSQLFKITYLKKRYLNTQTYKFETFYESTYIYRNSSISYDKQRVLLNYSSNPGPSFRVKGELYFRTPTQWKLYIESKHMTFFTALKTKILRVTGIGDDEYAIFMECLSSAAQGTPYEMPIFIFNVVDTVMDLISGYLDKTDKKILNIIKNKNDSQYVIIAWAAYYQQYCKIGRGYGWRTNNTIRFK